MKGIEKFLKFESLAGIALSLATIAALVFANSSLAGSYQAFSELPFEIRLGEWSLNKPIVLWINDGLMAIFFLLVALELKREVLVGELSKPSQIVLPLVGALGGIAAPAAVYLLITSFNPETKTGWAIPIATDIAFALAILSAFGSRIPTSLKTFLLTLAVFDDLGAILIIAFVYTGSISWSAKGAAGLIFLVLIAMNRLGVKRVAPYCFVGAAMWLCVLKSGVHATLAGVLLGLVIPYRGKLASDPSPLKSFEHSLHPWVSFLVLPIFAFANAGVNLNGVTSSDLFEPVTLGIITGLVFGKCLGVLSFTYVVIRLGFAKLPQGANWASFIGVAVISGVGFTMSLFIGTLAFESSWLVMGPKVRFGVLTGSAISCLVGVLILTLSTPKPLASDEVVLESE
ncbi:UNVERIFIED_CONTAM: hypothetical protein GTU68_054661 [Idotea baltica]|nr:hypothetical protein [Idotea baltica]